ncbi:MAG TPA: hypothetical protein PKD61_05285 [Polyangiaceae bacterium]|nr:hypothetical protein [Polyangiaceae bacterium]
MSTMRLRNRTVFLLAIAGFLGVTSLGHAQSEDELGQARQLYTQGLTQEAAGDWAGALSAFQQVSRIKMTPQVRYHIARCKENLGRLNEALGGYRLAEYEAERADDKKAELLAEIQKARESLEARIPKLVILRGEGASAIKIELDGVALGPAKVGREVSVDPGPHSIAGISSGGKRFEKTVEVAEGQTERITLDVPEELRRGAGGSESSTGASTSGVVNGGSVQQATSSSAFPWVVTGLGVASLAASGIFFALRGQAEKELDDGCLGNVCPDTLEATEQRGRTYALLSGVTLGVGIVGVGVGTVMLVSRNKTASPADTASVALSLSPTRVGLSGQF